MGLQIRHLRAFLAVVEERTFTDAALVLDLSQAAVSRSVAALERELGVRLLERGLRETTLTEAGKRIIGPARRTLAEADSIVTALDSYATEVRIGYSWGALGAHTVTVGDEWTARHPDRELLFVQSDSAVAGLTEKWVDFAVLRRRAQNRRVHAERVGTEPRHAALSTRDPLARRRRLDLADLADRTVAVDPQSGTTTPELWAGTEGPAHVRRTHNVDEWLTLIAGGRAVGITPEATVGQYARTGVTYRRLRNVPPVEVWLAWREGDEPADAQELVEIMRQAYSV
ncbi:LysR family transcriptional regulator [Gordonia jinhuaensis]|uniref:LysR family transcriptional regulator n=1 Tax=Gordonia jinhuaensis TaxID=1517702 RepID=A0A916WQ57_9ACTN|nr:LysR family transcriptional regulator [Gordonia jinhuaensis]GGB23956.1 LysR family transcriptional regulator [Gordonia jinhuaensis]